ERSWRAPARTLTVSAAATAARETATVSRPAWAPRLFGQSRKSLGAHDGLETVARSFAEQSGAERVMLVAWLPEEAGARILAAWGMPPEVAELELDRTDPVAARLLRRDGPACELDITDLPLITSGP